MYNVTDITTDLQTNQQHKGLDNTHTIPIVFTYAPAMTCIFFHTCTSGANYVINTRDREIVLLTQKYRIDRMNIDCLTDRV